MANLKYAVIGSGAIGGYYGGMLAKAGGDVHFLFNSDYNHVKENGLQVDSVKGNFKIQPINAYHSTSDMPKADVVFVCLKTNNNALLKEILPPLLHKDTVTILIQNGLGMEADVQEDFPNMQIAGAMAFICSAKLGEGHINHMDNGSINIGSFSCKNNTVLERINADFEHAGVTSRLVDLEPARWKKLIWNIAFNGTSVVLNTTTDKLLRNKDTRAMVGMLMDEVIAAANAAGKGRYSLDQSLTDGMLEMTDKMVPYSPSMKLDYDMRRPMEIEYIYARPVAQAMQAGYEMKCTKMLMQQLRYMESLQADNQ